jgi:hypothetical protein
MQSLLQVKLKMATNALEQIKKLDDQRARLLDQAKGEAMDRAQQAVSDLNALGFSYVIADSNGSMRGRRPARQLKDAPCPICNFKTNPPHDGRRHRSQGAKKVAFSSQELALMGFTKA